MCTYEVLHKKCERREVDLQKYKQDVLFWTHWEQNEEHHIVLTKAKSKKGQHFP